jgi:uncharacterized protein
MTDQSSNGLSPVEQSNRIHSLDVIRGIALLGILFINITVFGLPDPLGGFTSSVSLTNWNLNFWIIGNMFFEGAFRGLFSMLFGAGFILLITRGVHRGGGLEVADLYYRRTLWLLFFGVIHLYILLWEWDILFPFGIFGLMLFPIRNTKPIYLFLAGIFLLSMVSIKSVVRYNKDLKIKTEGLAVVQLKHDNGIYVFTEEQNSILESWKNFSEREKTEEKLTETTEAHLQNYLSIVKHRVKRNIFMQTTMVYTHWVWDVLSFMLIGIAFFKWQIFQGGRSKRFYLYLMLLGYAIGLGTNYYETMLQINSDFASIEISKAKQTYQLGRLFTTFGHIGFFMLFIKSGMLMFFQKALAAVGKMALTNYLMQTIICNTIFLGFGFGMFGKLQRYELYYVVIAVWIVQLLYSPIWLKYFKYGPAEWVWRSLSYIKIQPFRNSNA